jgi:uncharacterized protein YlzI (FlbEa/FlbD family)
MFIKITDTYNKKPLYLNSNVIESICEVADGTFITTLGDIGREPDSWTVIGYTVEETPEEIIYMIEEMKK